MIKSKLLLASLLILATGWLTGCSNDDDEKAEEPALRARVQLMTVFAPGQLGDMGYADRVMKGVNTLMKSEVAGDSLDVNFISSYDVESTKKQIAEWAEEKASHVNGAPYNRRLLVLTENIMVDWLADVKNMLRPSDEVLMLKVNEADVKAAEEKLDMPGRVHGLNISAASSIRKLEETREEYYKLNEEEYKGGVNIMRLYSEELFNYRDSISQVLIEEKYEQVDSPAVLSVFQNEEEIYNKDKQSFAFQMTYSLCSGLLGFAETIDYKAFAIVDCGAANSGAEFFLIDSNAEKRVVVLMLDADPNPDLNRFCITRHFDRALSKWTQLWLTKPKGDMPLMEIHGGWDGYCTDDINLLDIM